MIGQTISRYRIVEKLDIRRRTADGGVAGWVFRMRLEYRGELWKNPEYDEVKAVVPAK
jgi:hypothetical protein